jgi:hypothetical protein
MAGEIREQRLEIARLNADLALSYEMERDAKAALAKCEKRRLELALTTYALKAKLKDARGEKEA